MGILLLLPRVINNALEKDKEKLELMGYHSREKKKSS